MRRERVSMPIRLAAIEALCSLHACAHSIDHEGATFLRYGVINGLVVALVQKCKRGGEMH